MVLEILTELFKMFATYFEKHLVGQSPAFCIFSQLSGVCHVSCESSFVNFWGKCFCICFGVYGEANSPKQVAKGCVEVRLSVGTTWLIHLPSNLHKVTWKLVFVSFAWWFQDGPYPFKESWIAWMVSQTSLVSSGRVWGSYNSHSFPSANKAPTCQ